LGRHAVVPADHSPLGGTQTAPMGDLPIHLAPPRSSLIGTRLTHPVWQSSAERKKLLENKAFSREASIESGEGGIRTPDGDKPHTAFPVLLLQPLGHLSKARHAGAWRAGYG